MKVQKIKLNSYDYTWLVLDNQYLPIKPITEFIRYLNNIDKSPCYPWLYFKFLQVSQSTWSYRCDHHRIKKSARQSL